MKKNGSGLNFRNSKFPTPLELTYLLGVVLGGGHPILVVLCIPALRFQIEDPVVVGDLLVLKDILNELLGKGLK